MTRPRWVLAPVVPVFCRPDGASDRGVHGLPGWQPGCGTWCGSSNGRRPRRAGWRRPQRVPGRQNAARAEGRAWLDVPRQPARAVGSAWAEARPTAGPDRYADGRRWRAPDTFRAAQAPAVRPGVVASETTAAVMTCRRCLASPAGYPAGLQLSLR